VVPRRDGGTEAATVLTVQARALGGIKIGDPATTAGWTSKAEGANMHVHSVKTIEV
jgi:hypothetical protein